MIFFSIFLAIRWWFNYTPIGNRFLTKNQAVSTVNTKNIRNWFKIHDYRPIKYWQTMIRCSFQCLSYFITTVKSLLFTGIGHVALEKRFQNCYGFNIIQLNNGYIIKLRECEEPLILPNNERNYSIIVLLGKKTNSFVFVFFFFLFFFKNRRLEKTLRLCLTFIFHSAVVNLLGLPVFGKT